MTDKPVKSGQWSQPDIGYLTRMYGSVKLVEIARKIGRPLASVNKMVAKLFPESAVKSNSPWSAVDVARLKKLYGSVGTVDQWARIFKRPVSEIERKVKSFETEVKERPWTRESLATVKKFYGSRTNIDLELILGMPEKQIEDKAQELCMAKDKKFSSSAVSASAATRMPRWTAEDVETLKRMHGTASNSEIAQHLSRTTKSITSKANALGLYKTAEHLRQMGRDNVDWRYHRDKCEEEENGQSFDGNA
jgi:hypothetical protein